MSRHHYIPETIVSGGQTGVDRAALDAALELGIPCGGWCPLGRLAEDGTIPEHYPLAETESPGYMERTRRNVLDADATLILARGPLSAGTALTLEAAHEFGKAHMVVDLEADPDPEAVQAWLTDTRPRRLNVAGPRESNCPGIGTESFVFLQAVLEPD